MFRLIARPGGWLLAIFIAAAVFIVLNAGLRSVSGLRLDLTEEKLFTLSPGTERLLQSLDKPVTLTLYYSPLLGERAPVFDASASRVRDLLSAFDAIAGDKLTVREVDPEPFSEIEDSAVEAGVQPIAIGEGSTESVYFGLVGQTGDAPDKAEEVISFFQQDRARFLEYDLAKLVAGLSTPQQGKIGVITSVDVFGVGAAMGRGAPAWAVLDQMRERFKVTAIDTPEKLHLDQPDTLLILHPGPLEDPMLYAIDQFLMSGGDAIIFLDQSFESAYGNQGLTPTGPVSIESTLSPILDRWGVEVTAEQIAADRRIGRVVNAGTQADVVPVPYVGWLDVKAEQLNADDPITAQLNQLLIPTASHIALSGDSPLSLSPLIKTTDDAALMSRDGFGRQPDILNLLREFESDPEAPFTIAARLTGSVSTAFPDGPPPREPEPSVEGEGETEVTDGLEDSNAETMDAEPASAHLVESVEPLNVILVADADMLVDRYWVQRRDFFGQSVYVPHTDNGAFLINALDTLSGSDFLIGLRSRGTGERPFTVLDEMERQAEAQYREEERALRDRLDELKATLDEAREGEGQIAVLEEAKTELLETRRRLREVNRALRAEIEALESKLTFLNIGLAPTLVVVFVLALAWRRRRVRQ